MDKTANNESHSLRTRFACERIFGWRRLLVAAVAAIAVAITAVNNIERIPRQSNGPASALPGVNQQTPEKTDLQTMEAAFGPFAQLPLPNNSTPDTKYPALLVMRQDSSESASTRWTVTVKSTRPWEQVSAPQINALSVTGDYAQFKLSTSSLFVYTVRVGQPFVLESEPQTVMYIDASGRQWSTSFAHAKQLRLPVR